MIRIWKYGNAPESIRKLYPEGSAETWVVEAPVSLSAEVVETMRLRGLPVERLVKRQIPDGTIVFFSQSAAMSESKASGT
jgi:hypothetical protein